MNKPQLKYIIWGNFTQMIWRNANLAWKKYFVTTPKTHKLILRSFSYFTRFYLHRKHPSTLSFLDDAISTKFWLEAWFQNNALLKALMRLFVDKKCAKNRFECKKKSTISKPMFNIIIFQKQIRWLWNFIYVVYSCLFHIRD